MLTAKKIKCRPRSWFNLWYTYDIHKTGADTDGFGNTAASLRAVMESPYVITRDQMPSLK